MSQTDLPPQTAEQIHQETEDPPRLPETPPPPPPPGELDVSEMTDISVPADQTANQNRAETVLDLSRDTIGDNSNAALADAQSETSFSTDRRAWLLCFICLELASGEKMSCCKNFTCYMCFKLHVKTQISGGRFEITCPFCDKSIQQSEMLECLDEKTKKVLARLLLISGLKKNEKLCPRCDFLQKVPMSQTKPQTADATNDIKCSQCSLNWCFYCHSPSHKGFSCKENQKPDTAFVEWRTTIDPDLNPNAQKCPKCQIHIQRDGGCTHMKCSRCKTDFCYKCGKAFNWTLPYRLLVGDHYDKYSIVGCPTLLYPHSKVKRTSVRTLVYTAKKLALLPFVVVIGAMVIALIPFILISFVPVIIFMTSAKLCCKSQTTDNVVPA